MVKKSTYWYGRTKFKPDEFDVGDEVVILRSGGGREINLGSTAVVERVTVPDSDKLEKQGGVPRKYHPLYTQYKARLITGPKKGKLITLYPGRAFKLPVEEKVLEHYEALPSYVKQLEREASKE